MMTKNFSDVWFSCQSFNSCWAANSRSFDVLKDVNCVSRMDNLDSIRAWDIRFSSAFSPSVLFMKPIMDVAESNRWWRK